MEHTPNHPLSFRFLDDEAAIQWLAENVTHIQTLLSCVTRGDLEGIEAAISQAPQGILAEPLAGDPLRHTENLVIILIHLLEQAASYSAWRNPAPSQRSAAWPMRPSGPFAAGWRRPEAAPRQIPASSGPSVTWRTISPRRSPCSSWPPKLA